MITVWKYPILVADKFVASMPKGAKILEFQIQHGTPCIWALVDTERKAEMVRFKMFGTGHPIEDVNKLEYIGTALMTGGEFVWHLFKVA